jgi:hypothetical protein
MNFFSSAFNARVSHGVAPVMTDGRRAWQSTPDCPSRLVTLVTGSALGFGTAEFERRRAGLDLAETE